MKAVISAGEIALNRIALVGGQLSRGHVSNPESHLSVYRDKQRFAQ